MRILTAAIQSAVRPSCHTAPAPPPSLATGGVADHIMGQITKLESYKKGEREGKTWWCDVMSILDHWISGTTQHNEVLNPEIRELAEWYMTLCTCTIDNQTLIMWFIDVFLLMYERSKLGLIHLLRDPILEETLRLPNTLVRDNE